MTLHRAPAAHQLDEFIIVVWYFTGILVCVLPFVLAVFFPHLDLSPWATLFWRGSQGCKMKSRIIWSWPLFLALALQQEQKHVSSLWPGSLSNDRLKCIPSSKPHRGSRSGLNWFEETHCNLYSSIHDVRFHFFLCSFLTCPVFTFSSTPTSAMSLWCNINSHRSQVDLLLGTGDIYRLFSPYPQLTKLMEILDHLLRLQVS